MEDNGSLSPEKEASPDRVEFRYLKGNSFRVIHVDGAWGGVTPRGDIHLVLYNERPSIPDSVFNAITDEGYIGNEIPGAAKVAAGMVREVEVDAIMSLPTAKVLLQWLTHKINFLEKVMTEAVTAAQDEQPKQEVQKS